MPSDALLFHGLFEVLPRAHGRPGLKRSDAPPRSIPDPHTGRLLKVANLQVSDQSVCPACTHLGTGGYVSFEADLRMAFACANCLTLIWVAGA